MRYLKVDVGELGERVVIEPLGQVVGEGLGMDRTPGCCDGFRDILVGMKSLPFWGR